MRRRCLSIVAAVALAGGLVWLPAGLGGQALAQQGTGVNPIRDCQVLRTCNFARGNAVRGCLSSYTCRTCKLVTTRCNIAGRTKCQEFICSWGG